MNRDDAILAFIKAGNRGAAAIKLADELMEAMAPSRMHDLQIELQDALITVAGLRKLAEARKDALITILKVTDTKKLDYNFLHKTQTELL